MICPSSSQPRLHKRADVLSMIARLNVLGFKRRVYESNTFSNQINYTSLGYLDDGRYVNRIFSILKAVYVARKLREKNSLFYAASIDCLLIAYLAGYKKGYYEVGDLRSSDVYKSFFSKVEAFLMQKVERVIITSKYFYEGYYKDIGFSESRFLTLENKLLVSNLPPLINKESYKKIRIGVIGLLRYERPIQMLIDFVKKNDDKFEIDCYGDGPCKQLFKRNCSKHIRYHGAFKYPDDLSEIYSSIDISYVVYDSSKKNVRLALPNKLYESIYFKTPILVASETALSREVEKLSIGKSVIIDSQREFEQALLSIDSSTLSKFLESIDCLGEDDYLDDSLMKLRDELLT